MGALCFMHCWGKNSGCERVTNQLSWSRAPSDRQVQFQSGRKTSVWLVTGYGWSWVWPPVPLQVESWGWPSSCGYLEVEWGRRPWKAGPGCYPPLLHTEGNKGPGWRGNLTLVILVSGTAKTRVGKSLFQSQCPFCKALACIRMWIQVDVDSGLIQPLLGWVPSCSSFFLSI